jgi:hypothetical protein
VTSSTPSGNGLETLADRKDALQWFGRATHAIEDFYSHTNWVELSLTTVAMPATAALAGESCDLSAYKGLQSGYFRLGLASGMDGCPKGGPPAPFKFCHLGLNKDEPTSIEGKKAAGGSTLHAIAVERATTATTQLWLNGLHDRLVKKFTRKDYYADAACIFHKLAWDDKKSCVDLNGTWTLRSTAGSSTVMLTQKGTALEAMNNHLQCTSGGSRPYLFRADLTENHMSGVLVLCWDNAAVVSRCHVPETTDNIIEADLHRKGKAITLSGSYTSRHWSWIKNEPCVESPKGNTAFTMTRDAPAP